MIKSIRFILITPKKFSFVPTPGQLPGAISFINRK